MNRSIPAQEGRGIIALNGGAVELDSFTTPDKRYKTHPESGYCTCPRYENTGKCVKHPILAKAVLLVRELPSGASGTSVAEEDVIELCERIFAPVKGEHYIDSYNLLTEVWRYRHSTPAMKKYAKIRHHKVLALTDSRTGVA